MSAGINMKANAVATVTERLSSQLGPRGCSVDPATLDAHLVEWRGRYRGRTPILTMPANAQEVATIVRTCAEAGVGVTPQGGNTGLVGGQIPDGEVLLSLKRMNAIRSLDLVADTITAEAGVILASIHEAAASAGRMLPLSLASQGSATVGGLISTNAGGVHVLRYGMMRDLVLGLEVVLPNGDILSGLNPLRKDNTGYDLKQLFIGAEGTLGVITAATLKLVPPPAERLVAMLALRSPEDALAVLQHTRGACDALSAFELMSWTAIDLVSRQPKPVRNPFPDWKSWFVLLEFQTTRAAKLRDAVEEMIAQCMQAGFVADAVLANSGREAEQLWLLRESISEAQRAAGAQVNLDVSVALSDIPRFLDLAERAALSLLHGVRIVAFGHAGDGNIHYTVIQPQGASSEQFLAVRLQMIETVQSIVARLGGSISAEHGIGVARRDELPLYKSPVALALMKTIKAALDPQWTMNPRALLQR